MSSFERAKLLVNNPSKDNIDEIFSLISDLSLNEYNLFIKGLRNNVKFLNVLLTKDLDLIKSYFGDDFLKIFNFDAESLDSVAFINAYRQVFFIHEDDGLRMDFMKLVKQACILNDKMDSQFCSMIYELDSMNDELLCEHLRLLDSYSKPNKIKSTLYWCSDKKLEQIENIIEEEFLINIIKVYFLYFGFHLKMFNHLINNKRYDVIVDITDELQEKFNNNQNNLWYEILYLYCEKALAHCKDTDLNLILKYLANLRCCYRVVTEDQDYFEKIILNSNNFEILIKFYELRCISDYINSSYKDIASAISNIGTPEANYFLQKNYYKNNESGTLEI